MSDITKTREQLIEELAKLRQQVGASEAGYPREPAEEILFKGAPMASSAQIFDALPLPAAMIDAQGTVVDINQAFLSLAHSHGIEIRKEDRTGRHIASFAATKEERTQLTTLVDQVQETGEDQHLLWSGEDESGHRRHWNIHASAIEDTAGRELALWS
jgi:PAS domain-containing protein